MFSDSENESNNPNQKAAMATAYLYCVNCGRYWNSKSNLKRTNIDDIFRRRKSTSSRPSRGCLGAILEDVPRTCIAVPVSSYFPPSNAHEATDDAHRSLNGERSTLAVPFDNYYFRDAVEPYLHKESTMVLAGPKVLELLLIMLLISCSSRI